MFVGLSLISGSCLIMLVRDLILTIHLYLSYQPIGSYFGSVSDALSLKRI